MKIFKKYIPALIVASITLLACNTDTDSRRVSDTDKKVEQLLKRMTLAEKAGQMTQIGIPAIGTQENYWDAPDTIVIDTAKLRKALTENHVGSFVGKGFYPPSRQEYDRIISQIQNFALNNTRLGIPVFYATDAVHGACYTENSTVFPHQIALAATWQPQFAKKTAEITAYELRASNTALNYAPVIDITWQTQWGRVPETFGEDPYLTTAMANAFIQGSQGKDISASDKTAVCLKHLIGYGSPQYGKDRKNAFIPERYLRQYYLPPFKAALEKGARVVMISSGLVNSIPCHVNKRLITDILKTELGFTGFTISDWGDMQFLHEFHKTAESHKEAVKQMVNAGVDMCMVPYDASFAQYVVELVNEGKIPEERINDAVRRILRVKFEMGLFEKALTHYRDYPDFGSEKFAKESYKAASEGIILLKNENVLPIPKNKKILLTGVAANSLNYLNGPWTRSWSGQDTAHNDNEKRTIKEALTAHTGSENLIFTEGTSFDEKINIPETLKAAENADYLVACIGEQPSTERPSDIDELYLPDAQSELIKALHKTGKPLIIVLLQGRPRIINDIEPLASGILLAFYPGHEGGDAISDIIFGKINPSGKLPITYPKHAAASMPYIHTVSDRADNSGTYTDYDPQWPFGFGLSYTKFSYDTITVSKDTLKEDQSLKIKIDITNTGKRKGKEVVQLYLRDEYASIDPDYERLIRFKKTEINAGESKSISFKIDKEDLAFFNAENRKVCEEGNFILMTGNRNGITKKVNFEFKKK